MSTNIIPFPVDRVKARPDPALAFFALYPDVQRESRDPRAPQQRRALLEGLLEGVGAVLKRGSGR
jgi:hypothetical protein